MPARKPAVQRAWALVAADGELECFDCRLPIYWLKRIAKTEAKRKVLYGYRVVRVEIRECK